MKNAATKKLTFRNPTHSSRDFSKLSTSPRNENSLMSMIFGDLWHLSWARLATSVAQKGLISSPAFCQLGLNAFCCHDLSV